MRAAYPRSFPRRRLRRPPVAFWAIFGVILLFVLGGVLSAAIHFNTRQDHTVTVEEKWIKQTRTSETTSQTYMVSTSEGVFTVEDSLWEFHFRASDVYAGLKPGETYCVSSAGFRLGFLSSYRNIFDIVSEGACA